MKLSDVAILLCMNKDKLTIIKEYGEGLYTIKEDLFPVDKKKLNTVGKEWHMYQEGEAYTYKGHVYIRQKHCINGYDCIVTWLRSSKNVYTAHNIRMKVKELYGI